MMNEKHETEDQILDASKVTEDEASSRDESTVHMPARKVPIGIHCDGKSEPDNDNHDDNHNHAPIYERNEHVFAYDRNDDVYAAVIKRIKIDSFSSSTEFHPTWKYLVHFKGWNSRHDRWLAASKILPDDPKARILAEQSALKAKEMERKRKEKKALVEVGKKRKLETSAPIVAASASSKKKKKKVRASADHVQYMMHECCTLPFSLQQVMVEEQMQMELHSGSNHCFQQGGGDDDDDDTGPIMMNRMHDLPASITVERILKQFAKSSIKRQQRTEQPNHAKNVPQSKSESKSTSASTSTSGGKAEQDGVTEESKYQSFVHGMIKLFDHILPKYLLYQVERGQYLKLCTPAKGPRESAQGGETREEATQNALSPLPNPSAVYSGEYLLRMLARLPHLLSAIYEFSSSSVRSRPSPCPTTHNDDGRDGLDVFERWITEYQSDQRHAAATIVAELIVFLQKNRDKIFKGKYMYAPIRSIK